MKSLYVYLCSLMAFVGSACQSQAQSGLSTRIVRDSLFIPWELVWGPDNHIWFTQKNGYICRLEPVSGHIDTLYHETATVVQSEGGMLGLALHPSFGSQPYVYAAYNYLQAGSYRERIVRYTYNSASQSLSGHSVLLDNLDASGIHNGCRLLVVGDKLFITTGDAAVASRAQDLQSLSGKILRINLDGSIPQDNPLPGSPLWSWGHRNAQGMTMANGRMYISEHGPSTDDEVNLVEKGRNYGWPAVHGYCNTTAEQAFCADSNVVEPLMAWTPTLAVCGLEYYNHPMFPDWQGSLLMTTLKDQKLYRLELNAAGDAISSTTAISGVGFGRLRDLCIAPNGRVFISTSNSGSGGTGARVDRIIELYDPGFTHVGSGGSTDGGLLLHPNPAGSVLYVQAGKALQGQMAGWQLHNQLGQVVQGGRMRLGSGAAVRLDGLGAGIYWLQLLLEDGRRLRQSFVKE